MGFFDNLGAGLQGFGQGWQQQVNANRATGEPFTDHRGSFDASGARIPGSKRPTFWEALQHGMTDDKGLFRGGEQGRMFGRYRDYADKVNQGGSGFTLPGGVMPEGSSSNRGSDWRTYMPPIVSNNDTSNNEGAVAVVNTPDGNEQKIFASPVDEAREYAKTFDPQNPESVIGLQKLFSQAGITDWQGNPITADGSFGNRTLSALDFLRTGGYKDPSSYGAGDTFGFNQGGSNSVIVNSGPQPILNADASNDFIGDETGGGYNVNDSLSYSVGYTPGPYTGGGGPVPDFMNPNQLR